MVEEEYEGKAIYIKIRELIALYKELYPELRQVRIAVEGGPLEGFHESRYIVLESRSGFAMDEKVFEYNGYKVKAS